MKWSALFFIFLALFFFEDSGVTSETGSNKPAEPICINREANSKETFFIDQMNKPKSGGFVELWKKEKQNQTEADVCINCQGLRFLESPAPSSLSNLPWVGNLQTETSSSIFSPQCVQRVLEKIRPGGSSKRYCPQDSKNGTIKPTIPCVNNEISEYMAWSMDKTFQCLNDPADPMDAELFFKKINLESNFNFWVSNKSSGHGLGQMTFIAMQEVMGYSFDQKRRAGKGDHYKHDGRIMLENILNENKEKCGMFHGIANPNLDKNQSMYPRPYNANLCSLLSLDGGIQRNLLASLALFKYYRDGNQKSSAQNTLKDLKITKDNPHYSDLKNLITLMGYSAIGPALAKSLTLTAVRALNQKDRNSLNAKTLERLLIQKVDSYNKTNPSVKIPNYLKSINKRFSEIKNSPTEELKCTN